MTTTILILGGYGYAGLCLARHLLQETDARLVLAGRNLDKTQAAAARLNAQFGGGRVTGGRADAADPESLRRAFTGIDLVLVASTTVAYTQQVVRAALEAGTDYLDIQYAPKRLPVVQSFADEICRAGRCFITEAGFHPGLPAAMVRYAAPHFSRLESAILGGLLNMEGGLPYAESVDELIGAFKDYQGQTFKDGRWQSAGAYDMLSIDFGGEFGRRRCYSLFFEELRQLPDAYPSLKTLGFYMAGFNWFVDFVITPVIMLALKLWPERAAEPMGKLLCWGTRVFSRPPYDVRIKAVAEGEKDGQPVKVEIAASHPDGYEFTAVPVVACLMQYLDGSARKPGLWMMGLLAEPARLFKDMERRGSRSRQPWCRGETPDRAIRRRVRGICADDEAAGAGSVVMNDKTLDSLVEKENPSVRYFTLRHLLDRPEADREVQSARRAIMKSEPVKKILAAQDPEGYWVKPGPGYTPKYQSTVWQIIFLAELGADGRSRQVRRGCEYLIEHAQAVHGGFSALANAAPSGAVHCLDGNLIWALVALGYGGDARVRRAVEWLAGAITGDDFNRWYASSVPGPGFKCAANMGLPCAWGAVKSLRALANLPLEWRSARAQKAAKMSAEFLLSRDLAEADYPHYQRVSGEWFRFGFPLSYTSDVLEASLALVEAGYGRDPRLKNALELILSKRDADGRWLMKHSLNGKMWADVEVKHKPSKWVTLRALRVLKAAGVWPGQTERQGIRLTSQGGHT